MFLLMLRNGTISFLQCILYLRFIKNNKQKNNIKQIVPLIQAPVPLLDFLNYRILASLLLKLMLLDVWKKKFTKYQTGICFGLFKKLMRYETNWSRQEEYERPICEHMIFQRFIQIYATI